jgi:hypothetical protein
MTGYPVTVRKKTWGSDSFSIQEEWMVPVGGISFLKCFSKILSLKKNDYLDALALQFVDSG